MNVLLGDLGLDRLGAEAAQWPATEHVGDVPVRAALLAELLAARTERGDEQVDAAALAAAEGAEEEDVGAEGAVVRVDNAPPAERIAREHLNAQLEARLGAVGDGRTRVGGAELMMISEGGKKRKRTLKGTEASRSATEGVPVASSSTWTSATCWPAP